MGEKVLIKKEKRTYVEDLCRTVTTSKAKYYYVEDTSKDFHTAYGAIKKADFKKGKTTTAQDKEFYILDPEFIDRYKRIKRVAQTITLKDIGTIITECGLTKHSVVAEAGSGSGGLASYLGMICKKVYSFDINKEHLAVAQTTLDALSIKNVALKQQDVSSSFPVKNMDAVCLDLPEPWTAVHAASKAVKKGGFIISYSPCITQVERFVSEVNKHDHLLVLHTLENIRRQWKVDGKAVRPKSQLDHTAFLTFVRKLE